MLSRDVVERIVDLYGEAWTTQNPDLLSKIFTDDVVYMERVFDRKATFVGLGAVKEYWQRQIVGKQSNITFRHLKSRMIRDVDQLIAVVHWLAEMDNKREQRGPEKTHKRVRFAQMARLTFASVENSNHNDDGVTTDGHGYKVCELEEYAQPMSGPGVMWPGLELPEEDYPCCLRMEPVPDRSLSTPSAIVVECNYCQQGFKSRSQLFKHLSTTVPSGTIGVECQSIKPILWIWISLSVGYTSNVNLLDRIKDLLLLSSTVSQQSEKDCRNSDNNSNTEIMIDWNSCTWAVPPEWSTSAVVNVCSIKMVDDTWHRIRTSLSSSSSTPPSTPSPLVSSDGNLRIHIMTPVDRPCVSERREFEKYESFVPWRWLQSDNASTSSSDGSYDFDKLDAGVNVDSLYGNNDSSSNDRTVHQGWRRQDYHQSVHRKPLQETPAGEFCNVTMTQRLRTCSRVMKDGGKSDVGDFFDAPGQLKIRFRCSTLDRPYHSFCRISISMRQPHQGCVEAMLGLLVKFAIISNMSENDLKDEAIDVTDRLQQRGSNVSDNRTMILRLPSDFCVLLEPGLNRYEVKAGVQLSGGYTKDMTPDSTFWAARQSMDAIEHSIMREITAKLPTLHGWIREKILIQGE